MPVKRPHGWGPPESRTTRKTAVVSRRAVVAAGLGRAAPPAARPAWAEAPAAPAPDRKDDATAPHPPRARQDPWRRTFHGIEHVDEYAWLRASNWRAALGDPSPLPPAVLEHPRAPKAYAARVPASLG